MITGIGFAKILAVFRGGVTGVFLKKPGKILHIHHAAMKSYGLDLQTSCPQKVRGKLYAFAVNIIRNGFSRLLFEK